MEAEPRQDTPQTETSTPLGRLVRLTWKTLGGLLLFLILVLIIICSQGAVTVLHAVFWLVVAGLVVTRYVDIKVFHGQTSDNQPATLNDWVRYSVGLVMMSGFFWLLAHAIRNRLH
jgi:hypothetical protein